MRAIFITVLVIAIGLCYADNVNAKAERDIAAKQTFSQDQQDEGNDDSVQMEQEDDDSLAELQDDDEFMKTIM